MLTFRYNPATMRYDCYKDHSIITTLTNGIRLNLYCNDEDWLVNRRIEHHNTNGDCFICDEGFLIYLYEGL